MADPSRIAPHNQHVIDLYNAGYRNKDIIQLTGRNPSTISAIIYQARKRGDISCDNTGRWKGGADSARKLTDQLRKSDVRLGTLGKHITGISYEAWSGILEATEAGGYESIAEYLVDIAIEAQFENAAP